MICGEPLPGDPSWACQLESGHDGDWHVIPLYSGSVTWLVDARAREIDDFTAAKIQTRITQPPPKRKQWPHPWNRTRLDGEGPFYPCVHCGEPCTRKGGNCMAHRGLTCTT